ncbi:hypothetical protein O7A70_08805 [Mesorhizobium sp. Cs1299R1N1]|uniref:hypothetical protein n=1 Tax=Mesorhizobium sp. Cs1299R1N1 TaxID=3015172 RepID=UPI00301CE396
MSRTFLGASEWGAETRGSMLNFGHPVSKSRAGYLHAALLSFFAPSGWWRLYWLSSAIRLDQNFKLTHCPRAA